MRSRIRIPDHFFHVVPHHCRTGRRIFTSIIHTVSDRFSRNSAKWLAPIKIFVPKMTYNASSRRLKLYYSKLQIKICSDISTASCSTCRHTTVDNRARPSSTRKCCQLLKTECDRQNLLTTLLVWRKSRTRGGPAASFITQCQLLTWRAPFLCWALCERLSVSMPSQFSYWILTAHTVISFWRLQSSSFYDFW